MPIDRLITTPTKGFFLLGPRGTGKLTSLAAAFPQALTIDLLEASQFLSRGLQPALPLKPLIPSGRALPSRPCCIMNCGSMPASPEKTSRSSTTPSAEASNALDARGGNGRGCPRGQFAGPADAA